MSGVPFDRLNAETHGHWVTLVDLGGISHLAWKWNGGSVIGYLCCNNPELFEHYVMPTPTLSVTCMACMGTMV